MRGEPKVDKKEVKKPDQIRQVLIRGFEWTQAHAALVLGVIVLVLVAGAGGAAWSHFAHQKEGVLQEKYFVLEKELTDKKQGYEEAARAPAPGTTTPAPTGAKATGDLQKDYGTLPDRFSQLVTEAPKSKAAMMSALNLAELYQAHGQAETALEWLNKVNADHKTNHLVGALVVAMKGNLLAEKGDCAQAVSLWEKVVSEPKAGFLHGETKLRMGLCYEQMNDLARAESLYSEIAKQEKDENDSSAAKDAEKYLRLLKVKKQQQGS